MPFPKPLKKMTDEELNNLLSGKFNYNILIPRLIEAHLRKDEQKRNELEKTLNV